MVTSKKLLAKLAQFECVDATFKPEENPLIFAKGQGSLVYDVEGKEYVDLCAGFGALPFGHNPPFVQKYMKHQFSEGAIPPVIHGMGDVYPSEAKIDLIEQLVEMLPPHLERVSLALTGAGAVECAVKTAHLATGKTGFIAFESGYHGLDLGILPLTWRKDFREPFEGLAKGMVVEFVPWEAEQGHIDRAIERLERRGGFAGMIVEPIQGRGGVRPASIPWLASLKNACDRHSGLLIFDEVFTGLGRSGRKTFAEEIPCDLLCLGKALGGGMPVSACVGSSDVMNAWPSNTGEAIHTGTFFGHPMSCAIGALTLKEIQSEKIWLRAQTLGAKILKHFNEKKLDHVSMRGSGLMLALEFAKPGMALSLFDRLRGEGIIVLPSGSEGRVLSLTPALNIEEGLLVDTIERITTLAR
jgi:4-aminobutyrate aminotransferase/(S)-3-amino-2-methylpropionate transaminase